MGRFSGHDLGFWLRRRPCGRTILSILIWGYILLGEVAIPEPQLSQWSHHGSQDGSKRTHKTIRKKLKSYDWPSDVTYDFYLQGSYSNDTNIRDDSDVDVILKFNRTVYYDVSRLSARNQTKIREQLPPATYEWADFRREAFKALENKFDKFVAPGNKSIKIKPDPPRLAADVVVCTEHRKYTSLDSFVEGITFYALHDKRWIINYPQEHRKNGVVKNKRTMNQYKRTVRMFKNARNYLVYTKKTAAAVIILPRLTFWSVCYTTHQIVHSNLVSRTLTALSLIG